MDYTKLKRVYVAGKLNDDAVGYLYNVHKMMTAAEKVRLAGFAPFIPAIDMLMGLKFGYTEYTDYFDGSQAWLLASDAVFLTPGWETSAGTKREIELAKKHDIPVFESLKRMKKYLKKEEAYV